MKLELSFEYLVNKDTLKWVTVVSDQAILLSICLQGMVEELLLKRKGLKLAGDATDEGSESGLRRSSWSYMKRDGSSRQINIPRSVSSDTFGGEEVRTVRGMKRSSSRTASGPKIRPLVENDAFDGIGDDDL
jgi:sorting nexin-17